MKQFLSKLLLINVFLCFMHPLAFSQLNTDILSGQRGQIASTVRIGIVNFVGQDTETLRFGAELSTIIRDDLTNSGLFQIANTNTLPQSAAQIGNKPNYDVWTQTQLDAFVSGRVIPNGTQVRVEYRLFDPKQKKELSGFAFTAEGSFLRAMAHLIADDIYKVLTGAPGHFSTQIVFVSESGSATNRIKRLAIMDQDGANLSFLTPQGGLVLTPRFSPIASEITYMSYEGKDGLPRVYLYNIETRQREVLGEFPGMSFSPRFAPDGKSIIFSLSTGEQSDLYEMDLRNRRQTRLTSHPAIDTSPSFSPDGRRIVFESDRSGTQQIYTMDRDGSNVQRISFGEGRYATPVWSPNGDWIAFTRIHQGQFSIGVMRANGNDERQISTGFLVEGPNWAPNGRMLTYYKQNRQNADGSGGIAQIYVADIFSGQERQLVTPSGASDPSWSPSSR